MSVFDFFTRRQIKGRRPEHRTYPLSLEALEARCVPAVTPLIIG